MIFTELRILAGNTSPRIVGFAGAFIEGSFLCIAMEKSSSGDLDGYIIQMQNQNSF